MSPSADAPQTTWSVLNDSPLSPVNATRTALIASEISHDSSRYELRSQIGKGGMGEVNLYWDPRIGRDVAMKVLRGGSGADPSVRARFLLEAQVQGQLEHPSIVPVYDLGVDAQGAEYFTMKCLRGLTLREVIKGLAAGDPTLVQGFSRRKLLTAFSSICLAVDFAHSRGVVHRDLKPANVMLGAYGEVYLLDWGVAKILDATGQSSGALKKPRDLAGTVPGDILGTPGYIAPEQAYGDTETIDARADVYSLGAILFELLTLTRLHPKGDSLDVLRSTVHGADARASVRAPERDVPPELDAICIKATMPKPADRYPSARALHDAIERFLDGARDVELRRDLSSRHAGLAEAAVTEALAGAEGAEEARRQALGEVGRALALDAGNERARRALERILTEPPQDLPAEVTAEMDLAAEARHKLLLRIGTWADLVGVSLAAVSSALWLGVRDWVVFAAVLGFSAAAAAAKILATRQRSRRAVYQITYASFVFNVIAVLWIGRAFGPLHFMPLLLVTFTYAYSTTYNRPFRLSVTATALAALLAAVAVEVTGVIPPSYAFHDGAMTILPRAITHAEGPTIMALTATVVFMILVLTRLSTQFQKALWDAERSAFLQAWQLRQLLPDAAPRGRDDRAR